MKSASGTSSEIKAAIPEVPNNNNGSGNGTGIVKVEPIKQTINMTSFKSSGAPYTDSITSSNTRRRTNANSRFNTSTASEQQQNQSKPFTSFTDETSSEGALSTRSSDNGQAYEIIEYDYDEDANINVYSGGNATGTKILNIETDDASEILAELVGKTAVINIDDDSPAAAALRANAKIHVSSVGKAARAVQLQSVRRVLKRATGITKSGNKKGKPPRIPPTLLQHNKIITGTGPIDVDQYIDAAGDITDHSNNQDAIVEGIDEDNDDDDVSVDVNRNQHDLCEINHVSDSHQNQHPHPHPHPHPHQYGIDEPSFSEIGGDGDNDEIIIDESRNSTLSESKQLPKPTPSLTTTTSTHIPQQHPVNEKLATSMDRDMMHIPDGVAPGTVEAGKKVLRSVDPYDLLRVVRWKKKRTGHLKKKKSYVKGKVIDGEHELYTLSIAVMIGVRTSISRTNTELNSLQPPLKRWVNASDFRTTEKYEFHPRGGDGPLLPPHQLAHTFKFKDYCPVVFAYLRRMYGVNEFDFLLSVCGNANFIEFISNAKSGQFFFYSSDGRYMIKTMTNAESKFLRQILPDYFKHCCENPNTLITRFFGMYRVKLYHLRRNVKFVIMNSVYYTDKNLQTFYDLKGSSVGRDAKPGQAVLKDNDLRKRLPDDALALRPHQRTCMRNQLESDCAFLTKMDVMDYSMLVGVHYVPPFEGRTSLTYKKNLAGAGRGLGGLRIRRNTGGSTTNYGNNDDSEATSNEGEPNIIQQQTMSQTSGITSSPPRHKPQSSDIPSGSMPPSTNTTKSPQRPTSVSGHNRARSEDKLVSSMMLNSNVSKSPMRPPAVSGSSRSRSDTWSMLVQMEDGLEDDDNSYLHGSTNRPSAGLTNVNEETERKKQATVEKLFWPFHNLYDIHGHRRLHPVECNICHMAPCGCDDAYQSSLLAGYNIPKFLPPISDRKDGGLEMDTTGLQLPCTIKGGAPNGDLMFDGKIFYMGVIDILQQYNTRKEIESVYRMIQSSSKLAASCVPPLAYGRRFIHFFDQYTERPNKVDLAEQGQEVSFRV